MRSLTVLGLAVLCACAAPHRRWSVAEENDLFSSGAGKDRGYSQGLRLDWEAHPEGALARGAGVVLEPFEVLDPLRGEPAAGAADRRDVRLTLEQRIYNPKDLDAMDFVPDERPYAGILLAGATARHVRLDADADRRRDWRHELTLALGVTGDWSLAETAQRGAHYVLGEADAAGWQHQLEEEVLVQSAWDLRQRSLFGRLAGAELDLVSGGRAELGTAFTNAQAGFELRAGHGLPRDDRPWLGEHEAFALWLSAGARLKYAAHDITIDGSLWNDDPELQLTRDPTVWHWWFGVSARWGGFTFGYRFLRRTKEFEEELGYHDWGTIRFGYAYAF